VDRAAHWERVFGTKPDTAVSWYEERPDASLASIEACGRPATAALLDVGAGSSALVDHLLTAGYLDVTALDISATALARARARLGGRGEAVDWIVADVTTFRPGRRYDLWHDRAAFHFLTDEVDQRAYAAALDASVADLGWVILAAFAPHGPRRCSGLPVRRHDGASMAGVIGPEFSIVHEEIVEHRTPSGIIQAFTYARFRRGTAQSGS
jgi:SAM-dependent methyltransferase